MKKAIIFSLFLSVFFLFSGCIYNSEDMKNEYEAGYEDGYAAAYEEWQEEVEYYETEMYNYEDLLDERDGIIDTYSSYAVRIIYGDAYYHDIYMFCRPEEDAPAEDFVVRSSMEAEKMGYRPCKECYKVYSWEE